MYFKRSYDADSSFPKSSQNLAIYYFTMGNYNQAIQYASNAVKLFKYQVIAYDVLSKAYKALGNDAEAVKYQMLYLILAEQMRTCNQPVAQKQSG